MAPAAPETIQQSRRTPAYIGNGAASVVVARWENELDSEQNR
jgi:hypothetical protein